MAGKRSDRGGVAYVKVIWRGGKRGGHETRREATVPAGLRLHTLICDSVSEARRVATRVQGRAVLCFRDGTFRNA